MTYKYARNPIDLAQGTPEKFLDILEHTVTKGEELDKVLPDVLSAAHTLSSTSGQDSPARDVLYRFYARHCHDYSSFPVIYFKFMRDFGVGDIFLGILQGYTLLPALRKQVEVCARFYSKSRIVIPKPTNRGQFLRFEEDVGNFHKYLALFREHLAIAKAAIAQARPHGEGGTERGVKAGPFTLINTGGFDSSIIESCATVVEKAHASLAQKGLGKVCYGDIMISNTLHSKSNVLAFYQVHNDEMFVRANLKGHEHDAVRTVIHELGHRLQHKFLDSKKMEIMRLYSILKGKHESQESQARRDVLDDPDKKPKPGDTAVSKGKTYVVDRLGYSSRGETTVELHLESDPKKQAHISLVGWIDLVGIKDTAKDNPVFVTNYARTSPDENFAEMVSFYCLNKLPEDQVEMLERILQSR